MLIDGGHTKDAIGHHAPEFPWVIDERFNVFMVGVSGLVVHDAGKIERILVEFAMVFDFTAQDAGHNHE